MYQKNKVNNEAKWTCSVTLAPLSTMKYIRDKSVHSPTVIHTRSLQLSPALSSSPNPLSLQLSEPSSLSSAPTPVRLGLFLEYQLELSPGLKPCTPGTI